MLGFLKKRRFDSSVYDINRSESMIANPNKTLAIDSDTGKLVYKADDIGELICILENNKVKPFSVVIVGNHPTPHTRYAVSD